MKAVAQVALKLPPFISASTWSTALNALAVHVKSKRGVRNGVPRLTNGDVITILAAYQPPLYGIRAQAFPLWDQFAAAAYGWNPATGKLNATNKRRDAWFPDVMLAPLWAGLAEATRELDQQTPPQTARLDFDGRWDDVVFKSVVKQLVESDGAITDTRSAHIAFGIPLPACKTKDGKTRAPKCKRAMNHWPYLCEEWEKCDPVIVKDPITVVRDKATNGFQLLLLIGAAWILFDNSKPRRRRARNR